MASLTQEQMQKQVKATAKYEAMNKDKILVRVPIGVSLMIERILKEKPGGYASRAIVNQLIADLGQEEFEKQLAIYAEVEREKRRQKGQIKG